MTYELTPLLTGVRETDQGVMTYQRNYGRRIWLPMWSFLLRGEDATVVVDTGLDDFITPQGFEEETGLTPLFMEDALAEHGIKPEEVTAVINTHLHDDHCGNNALFTKAKVYVQQKELDFCADPHPLDHRYEPAFIEDDDIVAVDGDTEVLPGIEVFLTPGHTPGCQTVRVQTKFGPVVIAGMCSNALNFPESGPAVCPGVHTDALQAYDTAQRIKELGARILPLHDLGLAGLKF